jgi:uncharacterized protein
MRKAAILLVLALAACSSAKTDTYTLSAVPPSGPAPTGPALRPPIEVGEVGIPATIDRDEIVLVAPGDRLEVQGTSVWGAPVRQLIRRALSEDMAARLPAGSVLPPGAPTPRSGLRILTVAFERFSADTAGRVSLRADWTLTRAGQAPTALPHVEQVEVNAGRGTVAAVVPAMSRALGLLADRIAARIR